MSYDKDVHLCGKTLSLHTYPLFVQDTSVCSCAQASIISMTNYLHGKYGYKRIRINDINNCYTFGRKKQFPTMGLDPTQILEIFDANEIPVDYICCDDENKEKTRNHIDFSVESAMPANHNVFLNRIPIPIPTSFTILNEFKNER